MVQYDDLLKYPKQVIMSSIDAKTDELCSLFKSAFENRDNFVEARLAFPVSPDHEDEIQEVQPILEERKKRVKLTFSDVSSLKDYQSHQLEDINDLTIFLCQY